MRLSRRLPVLLLAAGLGAGTVAGCGDPVSGDGAGTSAAADSSGPASSGSGAVDPGGTTPTPTATAGAGAGPGTGTGTATADHAAFSGNAAPDTQQAAAGSELTVTALRVAAQDGFDRVVVELQGSGAPGWDVRYVDQAADPGSGAALPVAGSGVLQVQVTGVANPYQTGLPEYSGPRVLTARGTSGVTEVRWAATYEGTSLVVVGTSGRRPFRAFALSDPARVVVDVAR